jgi:hypothetical protein
MAPASGNEKARPTGERRIGASVRRVASELLLIAVGVLIALSADQWRSSRTDAQTEAAYLDRMMDDIPAALHELEREIQQTQDYLAASGEISRLPRTSSDIPEDSLAVLLANSLFNIVSWDGGLSTLDDLKNTGRIALISNPDIRRGLAEIDRLTAGIRHAEDDVIQTQHQTVDPFLIRVSDLPSLIAATRADVSPYLGAPLGREHYALVADSEFQNIVALRVVLLLNLEANYLEMREHLLDLSSLIATNSR